MTNPPELNREADGIRALKDAAILDTGPEPPYDEVVRNVSTACQTPIALISFADADRHWFKARIGFQLPEIPRDIGFDTLVIASAEPVIVPDTIEDPRFCTDPLVTSDLNIRFYAGAPIVSASGVAIGVLSVMDHIARTLTADQVALLSNGANAISSLIADRSTAARSDVPSDSVPIAQQTSSALLPDVMMRVGPDRRYRYVSPFALKTLGVSPDKMLGCEVGSERAAVPGARELLHAVERALNSRRIEEVVFRSVEAGGRAYESRIMPEVESGQVIGALIITRAVSGAGALASTANPPELSLSAMIAEAVMRSATVADLLVSSARVLADYSQAPLVRIWLRTDTDSSLVLSGSAGRMVSEDPALSTAITLPQGAPTVDALAESTFALESPGLAAATPSSFALPVTAGSYMLGIVTVRSAEPISDSVHDAMLEAVGAIAEAIRRLQDAESLALQATALARDLVNARLALQREAESASALAHELRTPLNSVLGLTALLLGTRLEPKQRELGEMTQASAKALLDVVNSTLEGPRGDAGAAIMELQPFNLRETMEEATAMLASRAQGKGIDLILRIAPTMPEMLIGDAGRIRQIVVNLVDNAVKFTTQGYVLVSADSDGIEDGDALITIEVEDTGSGIRAEQQEAIFDRYVQVGETPDARDMGVGLGLAIGREYAESMGGTIVVNSDPGAGAVFRFSLRLPIPASNAGPPGSEKLDGARILIVDGPELQQYALRELLLFWGARSAIVQSVDEMQIMLESANIEGDPFRVLLVDEAAGDAAARAITAAMSESGEFPSPATIQIVSIARAASSDSTGVPAALRITKPIRRARLLDRLKDALAIGSPESSVRSSGAGQPAALTPAPTVIDASGQTLSDAGAAVSGSADQVPERTALVIDDDKVSQFVARMMLEKQDWIVDVALSGAAALELFETRVYDLILIDCKMAGLDGYQTAERMRSLEGDERRTPIIAVTADATADARDRCVRSGMDGYILKPIHSDVLFSEILRVLQATAYSPESAATFASGEVVDSRALLARVAGNTEVLRSLFNLCQAECGRLLTEITEAVETGDRAAFVAATHKMRGSVMSMEARAAGEIVGRLEQTANDGKPADAQALLAELRIELDRLYLAMAQILAESEHTELGA